MGGRCSGFSSARIFIEKTPEFNLDDVDTFGQWVRIHDADREGKMPLRAKNLTTAERKSFLAAITEPMMAHDFKRISRPRGGSKFSSLTRRSRQWVSLADSFHAFSV
jgi:hypothetical protein